MFSEARRQSYALFILRVSVGSMMFAAHGWGKLTGYSANAASFSDPFGFGSEITMLLAIFAEVFCAALLVLGVGTRLVAIPLFATMLVAAFIIHADDPFQRQEFALLYALPFLVFLIAGGGSFSLGKSLGILRRWS